MAEVASGKSHPDVAETLLKELMLPTGPGMCGSCHSLDRLEDGSWKVHWLAKRPQTELSSFSFFSHAPHELQAELADCSACHRILDSAPVMETYASSNASNFSAGFHAVTRQDCAECHRPDAAGDHCTQCHHYHVDTAPPAQDPVIPAVAYGSRQ